MKILLTGNKGYIGTILTKFLLDRGYEVVGLDTCYYDGCHFFEWEHRRKFHQIKKDIRYIDKNDLKGIDAVIHFAALSNDPLGALNPRLTDDINFNATIRLAQLAKENHIKRFVYASSCSMYGISGDKIVTENDSLNPITEYGVSKVKSEEALSEIADNKFSPVFLRPGTVYGISPMLRLDLVVNRMVASAYILGEISIMNDGTPWRPLVHIEDFSRGFISCLEAPTKLVHNQVFNLGRNEDNYRTKDIAEMVKRVIPNAQIKYTNEDRDSRSYRVSFDKINTVLKDYFKPAWNLEKGIEHIYKIYKKIGLSKEDLGGDKYIRINRLKKLLESKKLTDELFWNST